MKGIVYKKHFFLLYKRQCTSPRILIKRTMIRAQGKNTIYWRRGPGDRIKTLNRLVLKRGGIIHMAHVGEVSWLQPRTKNFMSWWTLQLLVNERKRVMHSYDFSLQVIWKRTIKSTASYRKTPLCNHLYMFLSIELYCQFVTFFTHLLCLVSLSCLCLHLLVSTN